MKCETKTLSKEYIIYIMLPTFIFEYIIDEDPTFLNQDWIMHANFLVKCPYLLFRLIDNILLHWRCSDIKISTFFLWNDMYSIAFDCHVGNLPVIYFDVKLCKLFVQKNQHILNVESQTNGNCILFG